MPAGAKVFDIAFTVFVYLLAAAILFGALLFSFSTSPDKALFGYRYYTVLTGSMSPTYKVGDMIFVKLSDASELNVGDVITFNPSQDSDAYLTHRISEKLDNYEGTGVTCFRTKGDANNVGDSFLIDSSRVIGKVTFGIPGLGYVVRFVQLRWYLIVPVVIMVGVFFLLLKRHFLLGKEDDEDDEKSKGSKSDSDADKAQSGETAGAEVSAAVTEDCTASDAAEEKPGEPEQPEDTPAESSEDSPERTDTPEGAAT